MTGRVPIILTHGPCEEASHVVVIVQNLHLLLVGESRNIEATGSYRPGYKNPYSNQIAISFWCLVMIPESPYMLFDMHVHILI